MMKNLKTVLTIIALLFLSACGGGGSSGNGATCECNDGWISHSCGIQGACSSHGGVKK